MKTIAFSSLFAGNPTYNLPHAHSSDSHVQLGTGAAILREGPLPSLRFAGEFNGDDLGFKFSTTSYFGQSTEHFSIAGLRYQVHEGQKWTVAPYAMAVRHAGLSDVDQRITGRVGIAVESGGERIRYDGSVSLAGFQYFPFDTVETPIQAMTFFETMLLGSEHGVSFLINDSHKLGVGVLGVLPCIRHQWMMGKGPNISTTVATLGTQNIVQLDLGADEQFSQLSGHKLDGLDCIHSRSWTH